MVQLHMHTDKQGLQYEPSDLTLKNKILLMECTYMLYRNLMRNLDNYIDGHKIDNRGKVVRIPASVKGYYLFPKGVDRL
jgi:hypothetical protein